MIKFFQHHRTDIIRISGTLLALLFSLSRIGNPAFGQIALPIAATLIGGFPMFWEAYEALRKRRMTMELSMSIAVLATLVVGQYTTGLVITFFVLIAELLEHLIVDNGRRALGKLAELMPQSAMVRRDGQDKQVNITELKKGDMVIIRPGARIPVDGHVSKGNSFVDQSAITGESIPVEKIPADEVYAGTVNQSGALEVTATDIGKNTTFGKIIGVIEAAKASRAPIEKTADKLAARLVYFAMAGALITFIVTRNVTDTISALIVAGACGVAAGTPLAVLAGIGRTAREGIVIKGGIYLEQLAQADTVVLDKTGTLTIGQPVVSELVSFNGAGSENVMKLLATGEQHADHPLAAAILAHVRKEGILPGKYDAFDYIPGKGLKFVVDKRQYLIGNKALLTNEGIDVAAAESWMDLAREQGESVILVGSSGQLLGGVRIADTVRAGAKEAISKMKELRMKVILLSGDHTRVVQATGQALAADESIGDLLPSEKLDFVRQLRSGNKRVAMVGDGINDAPALTEANVGIAMGAGTDVAFESADMVLTTNDLRKVSTAITIGRQCMGVIKFNFWGTVAVDSAGMTLAFLGMLTPMLAAVIHVSSELIFILNSARLFRKS